MCDPTTRLPLTKIHSSQSWNPRPKAPKGFLATPSCPLLSSHLLGPERGKEKETNPMTVQGPRVPVVHFLPGFAPWLSRLSATEQGVGETVASSFPGEGGDKGHLVWPSPPASRQSCACWLPELDKKTGREERKPLGAGNRPPPACEGLMRALEMNLYGLPTLFPNLLSPDQWVFQT